MVVCRRVVPLSRSDLIATLPAMALALAVRIAWHVWASGPDWPDTAVYLAAGRALLATGRIGSPLYMPLYPLMLAGLGPVAVVWVQLVLSALTAGVVQVLTLTLFGSGRAAVVAGIGVALYPLLIVYAGLRLSETSYIFLLMAALLGFARGWFGAGSALFALSVLVRPSLEPIGPGLVLAFSLGSGRGWRTHARRLLVYGLIYGVVMAPWWLHNLRLYGRFVRLCLGDGPVMVLENNDLFPVTGLDFQALGPLWGRFGADPGTGFGPDAATGPAAAIIRDEAMKAAAWGYIKAHPGTWLRGALDRFGRFWNPTPLSPHRLVNLVGLATTFPVMVLAAAGLVRRWRRLLPLILAGLWLTAVHTAFHALPRYRLPLDPLLITAAAGALVRRADKPRPRPAGPASAGSAGAEIEPGFWNFSTQ